MNITLLSAELSARVPDLARECVTNREIVIANLLREAGASDGPELEQIKRQNAARQQCPHCLGYKVVNHPPGVPAGVDFLSSSVGPWPCEICNGTGLLSVHPTAGSDFVTKEEHERVKAELVEARAQCYQPPTKAIHLERDRLEQERDQLRAQLALAQKGQDASAETMKVLALKLAAKDTLIEQRTNEANLAAKLAEDCDQRLKDANKSNDLMQSQLTAATQRAEEEHELYTNTLARNGELRADKEKAQKACCELRSIVAWLNSNRQTCREPEWSNKVARALSISDCGKNHVSKEELKPLMEPLTRCRVILQEEGEHGLVAVIDSVSDRLQKLMEGKPQ